jgi:hypothetical protein
MIKEIGRTGYPVPKEQPPPETLRPQGPIKIETLERGQAPAEGITISGKRTEGASSIAIIAGVLVPECPSYSGLESEEK